MIRYISDLHLGHSNVINFDKRPFNNVNEMNNKLIENWNSVVNKNDVTYVLGDFCWLKKEDWIKFLDKLNGSKVLIKGNHDLKKMPEQLKSKFSDIKDYKEISDNGRKVILSHYPLVFYKSNWNKNIYHLYGHVHMTNEWFWLESFKRYIEEVDDRGESKHKCQMYNVGCMLPYMNYTPKTLEEIIKEYQIYISNI